MPDDDARSVFVDESGRRRTRTKNIARAVVAAAGIYVLLVIVGLTGSVSLPGVRLGRLSPGLPKQTADGPLGPRSKITRLPTATRRSTSTTRANGPRSQPGGIVGSTGSGQPGGAGPTTTPKATNPHIPTTTTHPKSSSTTTRPVTTTTKRRGPPTSTTHGPPSTKPGQGKGRT